MIYLFIVILLLIAYCGYLQYTFSKERKRYVEMIAAKDYEDFKLLERAETTKPKNTTNMFTARAQREKLKK